MYLACWVQHALYGKVLLVFSLCSVHWFQVGIMGDVRSQLILHYFTYKTKINPTESNQIKLGPIIPQS